MGSDVVYVVAEEIRSQHGILRRRRCGGKPTGFLIAFEGLDGSGLSTHSRLLAQLLRQVVEDGEYLVVTTKEPTGSPIGFLIWEILKGYLPEEFMQPDILALLFTADRLYHIYSDPTLNSGTVKGIAQAMAEGYIVVTDRYKYSTIAYQMAPLPGARSLDQDLLWQLARLTPPPHLLVYLDIPPEESIKRIALERNEIHLYENMKKLAAIHRNFHEIIERLQREPEWPRIGPGGDPVIEPWYHYTPRAECIYSSGPAWPHVLRVKERDTLEETFREIAQAAITELIETGLLVENRVQV